MSQNVFEAEKWVKQKCVTNWLKPHYSPFQIWGYQYIFVNSFSILLSYFLPCKHFWRTNNLKNFHGEIWLNGIHGENKNFVIFLLKFDLVEFVTVFLLFLFWAGHRSPQPLIQNQTNFPYLDKKVKVKVIFISNLIYIVLGWVVVELGFWRLNLKLNIISSSINQRETTSIKKRWKEGV